MDSGLSTLGPTFWALIPIQLSLLANSNSKADGGMKIPLSSPIAPEMANYRVLCKSRINLCCICKPIPKSLNNVV